MTAEVRQGTKVSARYKALDGLRGIAALVVVVHHCFLVSPQFADAKDAGSLQPWVSLLTYSPLHLIWAGTEAVFVFFILSGFVLTLPFLRDLRPSWAAYYPKRMIRIYLPVWASLFLALALAWLVPRTSNPEFSSWINLHDQVPNLLRDSILLGGAGALNSPLWSLRWEMIFSLLLPVYLLAALRFKQLWLAGVAASIVLIGVGAAVDMRAFVYLPMFGIGVLMAVRRDELERLAEKLPRWSWPALMVSSMILLSAMWTFPWLPVATAMAAAGGALLIFLFIAWRPAMKLGTHRWVHWLGSRSFSLYLVHEPIVVSVAFALNTSNAAYVFLMAAPLSLITAEAFYRCIEQPSLKLAGAAGRALSRRRQPVKGIAQA